MKDHWSDVLNFVIPVQRFYQVSYQANWELATCDQLPVGLIAHLVRVLHWYRRGHGFDSHPSLNFLMVVNLHKMYILQYKYMNFIYPSDIFSTHKLSCQVYCAVKYMYMCICTCFFSLETDFDYPKDYWFPESTCSSYNLLPKVVKKLLK